MHNLPLIELYILKWKSKNDDKFFNEVCKLISIKEKKLFENTSATGGVSVGGMGAVVNAQPSGLAGVTIGTNWASGGGTEGSGDVSIPYNPSGSNRTFQKIPAEMGQNHGPRTGKRSRKKRLSLKSLKDIFTKRQDFISGQNISATGKKVMNFDDYFKDEFTKIKKS